MGEYQTASIIKCIGGILADMKWDVRGEELTFAFYYNAVCNFYQKIQCTLKSSPYELKLWGVVARSIEMICQR